MDDGHRLRIGAGALAGALAGAGVGVVDGIRAACLFGSGFRIALVTGLLAASVDALVGLAAGAAAEVLIRLAVWGRRRSPPIWARALAFAESYDVLAPECETEGAATGRFDFDNAVTLPSVHAPSRSHGAGLH